MLKKISILGLCLCVGFLSACGTVKKSQSDTTVAAYTLKVNAKQLNGNNWVNFTNGSVEILAGSSTLATQNLTVTSAITISAADSYVFKVKENDTVTYSRTFSSEAIEGLDSDGLTLWVHPENSFYIKLLDESGATFNKTASLWYLRYGLNGSETSTTFPKLFQADMDEDYIFVSVVDDKYAYDYQLFNKSDLIERNEPLEITMKKSEGVRAVYIYTEGPDSGTITFASNGTEITSDTITKNYANVYQLPPTVGGETVISYNVSITAEGYQSKTDDIVVANVDTTIDLYPKVLELFKAVPYCITLNYKGESATADYKIYDHNETTLLYQGVIEQGETVLEYDTIAEDSWVVIISKDGYKVSKYADTARGLFYKQYAELKDNKYVYEINATLYEDKVVTATLHTVFSEPNTVNMKIVNDSQEIVFQGEVSSQNTGVTFNTTRFTNHTLTASQNNYIQTGGRNEAFTSNLPSSGFNLLSPYEATLNIQLEYAKEVTFNFDLSALFSSDITTVDARVRDLTTYKTIHDGEISNTSPTISISNYDIRKLYTIYYEKDGYMFYSSYAPETDETTRITAENWVTTNSEQNFTQSSLVITPIRYLVTTVDTNTNDDDIYIKLNSTSGLYDDYEDDFDDTSYEMYIALKDSSDTITATFYGENNIDSNAPTKSFTLADLTNNTITVNLQYDESAQTVQFK